MQDTEAFIAEFVVEGNEKANQLEKLLIDLEKTPGSSKLHAEAFRVLHTIKGATSFMGFTRLCALAHSGESLLVRLRDGTVAPKEEITSALLSMVDAIREILFQIETTGKEGNADHTVLLAMLTKLHSPT